MLTCSCCPPTRPVLGETISLGTEDAVLLVVVDAGSPTGVFPLAPQLAASSAKPTTRSLIERKPDGLCIRNVKLQFIHLEAPQLERRWAPDLPQVRMNRAMTQIITWLSSGRLRLGDPTKYNDESP